jgi:hypothetical protein
MRTLWLVALAACASTKTIVVRPAELRLATQELSADHSAIVSSTDGDVREIRPVDHVELVDRQGHHYTMLLRDLAVRCNSADSDDTLCGYDNIDHTIVELPPPRPSEPTDHGALYRDGILLTAAGLVTCSLACGEPYNYISAGVLSAATATALVVAIYVMSQWHPN